MVFNFKLEILLNCLFKTSMSLRFAGPVCAFTGPILNDLFIVSVIKGDNKSSVKLLDFNIDSDSANS